jgi:antitoxin component YwqK of YwqJK toxin-antitoxin module
MYMSVPEVIVIECNIDHVQGTKHGACSYYGEVGIDATERWFLTARAGVRVQVSVGRTVICRNKQGEKVEKERRVKKNKRRKEEKGWPEKGSRIAQITYYRGQDDW